jgi:hypothetical protein
VIKIKKMNINKRLYPKKLASPERRCSSHTFRYGYLVTT